jgi:glycosyltransferase involved in cell wall biosynthesis
LAVADRFVGPEIVRHDEPFTVLRSPLERWLRGDVEPLLAAAERFAPDWISLQMVPYAYEPRGLLVRSAGRFAAFTPRARRHVMFHEIWLGEATRSQARHRAIGWVQKKLLARATRMWAPSVVHTSNPAYRELLRRAGIAAQLLPLPGNIAVVPGLAPAQARQRLLCRIALAGERGALLVGVFGSIHADPNDVDWVAELRRACAGNGRALVLLQIGRAGREGTALWSTLRRAHGDHVTFAELGESSPEEISVTLQALDLGVATTPWALIGKSGSVAAMLEHGVPVAVLRDDVQLRGGHTPPPVGSPLLHRLDRKFLELVSSGGLARRPPAADERVYDDFIEALRPAADPAAC